MNGHDDDDGEKGQHGVEQSDVLLTVGNRQGAPAIALRWRADRGGIVKYRAITGGVGDTFSRWVNRPSCVSGSSSTPTTPVPRQAFLIP
jgi:hypothetical protein